MGEGGVPPLSVKFFFVKNRPKNSVFWAKNVVFGGIFFEFRPVWGGVPPPFRYLFSVGNFGREVRLEILSIFLCKKMVQNIYFGWGGLF